MARRRRASDAVYHRKAWQRVRLRVLDRDGWTCQLRGPGCTLVAGTVDHIRALSEGGDPYDPANLRAACRHCNYSRHHPARIAHFLAAKGFTYRNTQAPRETRL